MRKAIVIILTSFLACAPPLFQTSWTAERAPKKFRAVFETTSGNFEIEAVREWSPAGVDRLYQLIKRGFYTDVAIFRVVPGYVAQFGISGDTILNRAWQSVLVPDEPVIKSNTKGTISFARGGKHTRSTQLYVNLVDNNPRLDTLSYMGVSGFPVVAEITSGMDKVEAFFSEYGEAPGMYQDSIQSSGNRILERKFPELDYITRAYLTTSKF